MPLQAERDSKNSLRFYLTLLQGEVPPVSIRATDFDISKAEQLLSGVKAKMAENAMKKIVSGMPKLKGLWPSGSYGDTKPYAVKRPKAGTVPAHYRVGVQITFNDPTHAQTFAKAAGIS